MNLCKAEAVTVFLCSARKWQDEPECKHYRLCEDGYCQFRRLTRNAMSGFDSLVICTNRKAHYGAEEH